MSISIEKNYPLDNLNTFNISAKAKFFYEFNTLEKLKGILSHKLLKTEKSFILGGEAWLFRVLSSFATAPYEILFISFNN